MPEEEKKEEKTRRVAVDLGKYSPPPEPVNVSPFQSAKIKEGLTSPPPEPVEIPPFTGMKTTQSKEPKESKKTEGQQ